MKHKKSKTNPRTECEKEEEGDNDREALEQKKKKLIHYGTRREHIFVRRRHIQFFPRFFFLWFLRSFLVASSDCVDTE